MSTKILVINFKCIEKWKAAEKGSSPAAFRYLTIMLSYYDSERMRMP